MLIALTSIVLIEAGLLLLLWVELGHFVIRLGQKSPKCTVFEWPRSEVQAIYRGYFRVLLGGGALYGISLLTVWWAPDGVWIATGTSVGLSIILAPAIALVGFTICFHYGLHLLLDRCRLKAETALTAQINAAYRALDSGGQEISARLRALLAGRQAIRQESTFPADLRVFVAMIAALLGPSLDALIRSLF